MKTSKISINVTVVTVMAITTVVLALGYAVWLKENQRSEMRTATMSNCAPTGKVIIQRLEEPQYELLCNIDEVKKALKVTF